MNVSASYQTVKCKFHLHLQYTYFAHSSRWMSGFKKKYLCRVGQMFGWALGQVTCKPPQSQQALAERTVQERVSFWWFLKLTVRLIIMCLYCTWLLVTGLKQYYKGDVLGTLKTCIFLCMYNQCRFVTLIIQVRWEETKQHTWGNIRGAMIL